MARNLMSNWGGWVISPHNVPNLLFNSTQYSQFNVDKWKLTRAGCGISCLAIQI